MSPTKPTDALGNERRGQDDASQAILAFADRLRSSRTVQPEQRMTFESWVAFKVSSRTMALPVSHVREILRLTELTGVPNAPRQVAGVMNLRGHVLPVIDTHALLGLRHQLATDSSRILVFLLDNRAVGLIVDDVTGLEKLPAELFQSVTDNEPLAQLARGHFAHGDQEPLLLLEPARLLAGNNLAFN
ncbi:MAG: purine-binding chemotaxis protein CheW [bacterium]|nr:purine-binding chemotaxis protein CheW [bacterium]